MMWFKTLALLACVGFSVAASHAAEVCEFDGRIARSSQDIAGRSGTLICKDGVTNTLNSEKQVVNGSTVGRVKEYRTGVLVRDYSVNAKGAYDGTLKEYTMTAGTLVLLKEINYRAGAPVGISKSYSATGDLTRLSFNTDGAKELAFAEFTSSGRLAELTCADRPVFAPLIDDTTWCGHKGEAVSVTFYGEDNLPRSKNVFERGVRRQRTLLWKNGMPQAEEAATAKGGIERQFYEDGTKKRESEWVHQGQNGARVNIVDMQYAPNGVLISDYRWRPVERGTQPVSVSTWYPSGAPRMKSDFVLRGAPPELVRREVIFHENGQTAGEGMWGTNGRQDTTPRGKQTKFNTKGVLVAESTYSERGEVIRERSFDDSGRPLTDYEITPDGQRVSLIGKQDILPRGLNKR